ncbi:MAG: hypothetical protein HRF43_13555 [Phycisphaerae bacterium]|jgi:hypothetical protein
MKNKPFDCVEMKRRGARRVQEATAGMTLTEKVEYWRQRDAQFRREQEALVARQAGSGAATGGDDVIDAEFEEKR